MRKAKKNRRLGKFFYILCVAFLITMDTVALANVAGVDTAAFAGEVEMKGVYPCSGTKKTGSDLGFTYKKNDDIVWQVEATHSETGIKFYAYVLCSYYNGILGIGKTDSCKITSAETSGVCCFAGVQCGGAIKFTNTVAGQFQSSIATVSHDADDATYRIAFGTY